MVIIQILPLDYDLLAEIIFVREDQFKFNSIFNSFALLNLSRLSSGQNFLVAEKITMTSKGPKYPSVE